MSDKCPKCGAEVDLYRGDFGVIYECGTSITHGQIEEGEDCLRYQLAAAQAENKRLTSQLDHTQARYDALRITSETTIGQLRQQAKHLEDRAKELEDLLPLCKQILEWDEKEWKDDGAGFDALKPALIELRAAYALAARKESL